MKSFFAAALMGSLILFSFSCNPCKKADCQYDQPCVDGSCQCGVGFEGDNCGTLSRDKFVGAYTATSYRPNNPSSTPYNFDATIYADLDAPKQFLIYNHADVNQASNIMAYDTVYAVMTSSTTFEIPNQRIYSPTDWPSDFEGDGRIEGTMIIMNYNWVDSAGLFPSDFLDTLRLK